MTEILNILVQSFLSHGLTTHLFQLTSEIHLFSDLRDMALTLIRVCTWSLNSNIKEYIHCNLECLKMSKKCHIIQFYIHPSNHFVMIVSSGEKPLPLCFLTANGKCHTCLMYRTGTQTFSLPNFPLLPQDVCVWW